MRDYLLPPSANPIYVVAGVGVGWGWIIMAEIVVLPEYGLGGLIGVSERRSHTEAIYAVIIVIVLIAIACDQLWRWGGDLLFPSRRKCE